MSSAGSKYRPDVDGLRAVSVILVFINHANENWLPSGFVGVDVFFVISGYVVTSSLLSGNHGNGWSGLREFWRRRMLRILPPLIFFVFVTTLFFAGFFALNTSIQFQSGIRTGMASLVGVSNLYLFHTSTDYFLLDRSTNPFLHTWSLGVEEQFYVVFAILFFGLSYLFKRRLVAILSVVFVFSCASFFAFWIGMREQPVLTYYSLHSRFWELGLGVLIAFWGTTRSQKKTSVTSELVGIIGLSLVFVSAVAFEGESEVARYAISTAVLGASMFIASGAISKTHASRLLSLKALVFIGTLSYSIYLYHWPILVFIKQNITPSIASYAIGTLAIFCLAYASFILVETPFRKLRLPLITRVIPLFSVMVLAAGATLYFVNSTQGQLYAGTQIEFDEWLISPTQPYANSGNIRTTDCLLSNGSIVPEAIPESCFTQTSEDWVGKSVFLIGDSHAFSNFAMIASLEEEDSLRGIAFVHDGCSIHKTARANSSCERYKRTIPDLLREHLSPGDFVFVAAHFPLDKDIDIQEVKGFLEPIDEIASQNKATLVVEVPHLRSKKSAISCTEEWFRTNYIGCTKSLEKAELERQASYDILRKITRSLSSEVLLWDALPHLCRNGQCPVVQGATPVLRDQNHLSVSASTMLSPHFISLLRGSE